MVKALFSDDICFATVSDPRIYPAKQCCKDALSNRAFFINLNVNDLHFDY